MAEPRIKAAVFDVDGMLIDSRELIFQSYEHTLRTHGVPIPDRTFLATQVGQSLAKTYAAMVPEHKVDALMQTHRDFQIEKYALVVAYPHLIEMLEPLKTAGLKLAIFSARQYGLEKSLQKVDINNYFDVMITGGHITKNKPDPEGLLLAIKKLKVKPAETAMLGDAIYDIQAGKNAKVGLTIGITHGFGTKQALQKAKPDFLVDSLAEIPAILLAKMGVAK